MFISRQERSISDRSQQSHCAAQRHGLAEQRFGVSSAVIFRRKLAIDLVQFDRRAACGCQGKAPGISVHFTACKERVIFFFILLEIFKVSHNLRLLGGCWRGLLRNALSLLAAQKGKFSNPTSKLCILCILCKLCILCSLCKLCSLCSLCKLCNDQHTHP